MWNAGHRMHRTSFWETLLLPENAHFLAVCVFAQKIQSALFMGTEALFLWRQWNGNLGGASEKSTPTERQSFEAAEPQQWQIRFHRVLFLFLALSLQWRMAKPENRENKKWKFSFFFVKDTHCQLLLTFLLYL